jgi:hypothetical protein
VKSRFKSTLVLALKALLAVLLIGWLLRSGNLDLGALRVFVDRPALLAGDVGLFLFAVLIATMRFRVLLGICDVQIRVLALFRLQLVAMFFNVVIPGNIGGDFVKALYVARDNDPSKRTTILLLAFVERLIGVAALVFMGTIVTLLRPSLFADPVLRPLATTVVLIGAATFVGGAGALLLVRRAGARLERFTRGPSAIARVLTQLVASMRILSAGPRRLLGALLLSMLYHAAGLTLFSVLTGAIVPPPIPYPAVATVFPLGILTLLLPLSPAGMGVGHVAFKRLFDAIGLAGGATVFNVYLLGQLAPCLLGVFPFLALKRRGELPTEVPAEPPA